MGVPRGVRVQRRTMRSSSYIAARTRERARLDYLDAEIKRLEKIATLKREIKVLDLKGKQ